MKKGLLLLLVGVMACFGVSVKAHASARLDGMGATVQAVEDLDMVFLYPNKTLEYSNILNVRGLIGGAGINEYGGVIMKDDAIGGIGVFTNMPVAAQVDPTATPNRFLLMWGDDFSGTKFGAALKYSSNAADSNPNYNRDMGINLGVGLTANSFSQIDIHAGFDMGQAGVGSTSTANSPSAISVGVLAQNDLDANNDLRMFADVLLVSDRGFVANVSDTNVDVGLAANRKVNDGKGLVSTGVEILYTNDTGVASDWGLDWFGAAESKVADWLTLRTGLKAGIYDATAVVAAAFKTGVDQLGEFPLDLLCPTSFENSITNVQPGRGIFFGGAAANNIVTVSEADSATSSNFV